ncbi:TadE family protein [Aminobacterium colombiense]|jgi:adenylate cyclase class IV|uniref:TadE/TadG family type IV pilus assembly protein n=1 Tax=Aminobacterium colombiense TaxID=81468 RepID=UPI002592BF41|nr:TadE family protein [uncultured Aminobacterium sp.]
MTKYLQNNRGAAFIEAMYVFPMIILMLLAIPEIGFYIVDSQVVNTAMDLALRQAQIDGYFSGAARALAEETLEQAPTLRNYTLSGTEIETEWGGIVEVRIESTRTMYIFSAVEVNLDRAVSGLSEFLP